VLIAIFLKATFGLFNISLWYKPIIIPNEKNIIIRQIFVDLLKGQTQSEIRHKLKKAGHFFSESSFASMIRNRVYAGQIFVTGNTKSDGYYVKGLHEPTVTIDFFYQVQEILAGDKKAKKKVDAKSFIDELALRGLLDCDNCSQHLTGSASTGREGKKYFYYHCNYCGKIRLRAEEVHKRVENILDEIVIKGTAKMVYDGIVKKMLTEKAIKKRPVEKIEDDIRQTELRIRNMKDNMADGRIDIGTFNCNVDRYKKTIATLRSEKTATKGKNSDYDEYLKKGIDLLSNFVKFYSNADIHGKKRLIPTIHYK